MIPSVGVKFRGINMNEMSYIISLIKYAVDKAYAGEEGVYHRTRRVLAIRGISPEEFGRWEELYYCGMI